jgi:hypothetical protein
MAREPEGKLKRVAFGQIQTSEGHQLFFTGPFERHLFENVGHNPPQEVQKRFPALFVCGRK